jgi:hypothetical protein
MLAEAGSVLPIASGVSRYHSHEAVTGQFETFDIEA